jgi:hypothetical protein
MISFHAAQIEIWKELFVPMVLKLELPAMDIDAVCWLVAVHAIEGGWFSGTYLYLGC